MALLELQTRTDGTPHYTMRTKLDGVDYELTFRFGERREAWVFDLRTLPGTNGAPGEDIITGQLVIVGQDLLRRCTAVSRPPGRLFALLLQPDEAGRLRELPGLTDLGSDGRWRMYYREAD